MARACLIFHDSYSSPDEPWIDNLSRGLRSRGYAVFVPRFPTPIGQDIVAWKIMAEPYKVHVTSETVVVGVGVGAVYAAHFVSELSLPVAQLVLLAPFSTRLANETENMLVGSFITKAIDWTRVRAQALSVSVFASSDDMVVPRNYSEIVANALGVPVQILEKKGHFKVTQGVRELPEILTVITTPASGAPVAVAPMQPAVPQYVSPVAAVPAPVFAPSVSNAPLAVPFGISTASDIFEASNPQSVSMTPPPLVNASSPAPLAQTSVVVPSVANSMDGMPTPVAVSNPVAPVTAMPVAPMDASGGVRSLRSDFSAALSSASTSEVTNVVNQYRQGVVDNEEKKHTTAVQAVYVLLGGICLVAGVWFGYQYIGVMNFEPEVQKAEQLPLGASVAFAVPMSVTDTQSRTLGSIGSQMTALVAGNPEIGVLQPKYADGNLVPASGLLRSLQFRAPSELLGVMDDSYILGVSRAVDGASKPFAVFKVRSGPLPLSAMLEDWEPEFAEDMMLLLRNVSATASDFEIAQFANQSIRFADLFETAKPSDSVSPKLDFPPVSLPDTTNLPRTGSANDTTGARLLIPDKSDIANSGVGPERILFEEVPSSLADAKSGDVIVLSKGVDRAGNKVDYDVRTIMGVSQSAGFTVFTTLKADPIVALEMLKRIPVGGGTVVPLSGDPAPKPLDIAPSPQVPGPSVGSLQTTTTALDVIVGRITYTTLSDTYIIIVTDETQIPLLREKLLIK